MGASACGDRRRCRIDNRRTPLPAPRERRRTWHPPPLPGTAAHPTFPRAARHRIPDPEPDGLVSVGYLLRREGRRAAHAVDRPLVPRARDLLEAGARTSTHRAAVAAGALLAVTTVLGSNALGDSTIISGVGVDEAADAGPAAVPPPAEPLPLAAADAPVRQVMAALQSAGTPVRAVLVDGTGRHRGSSGAARSPRAGIVAAALGAPAVDHGGHGHAVRIVVERRRPRRRRPLGGGPVGPTRRRDSAASPATGPAATPTGTTAAPGRTDGTPSRPVVPLPSRNPDLPPPVTGSDIVDGSLGGSGSAPDGNPTAAAPTGARSADPAATPRVTPTALRPPTARTPAAALGPRPMARSRMRGRGGRVRRLLGRQLLGRQLLERDTASDAERPPTAARRETARRTTAPRTPPRPDTAARLTGDRRRFCRPGHSNGAERPEDPHRGTGARSARPDDAGRPQEMECPCSSPSTPPRRPVAAHAAADPPARP